MAAPSQEAQRAAEDAREALDRATQAIRDMPKAKATIDENEAMAIYCMAQNLCHAASALDRLAKIRRAECGKPL